jgi:hypothetical protein
MTWADAKCAIIDVRGGRCTDCYLEHRARETSKLMAQVRTRHEQERVMLCTYRLPL